MSKLLKYKLSVSIDKEFKLPVYVKASIFLVGIFALLTVFYIAQAIIVPLVFAFILAITLHPVVNFFVSLVFSDFKIKRSNNFIFIQA